MNDIQRNIIATAAGFQPTEAGLYEVRYSYSLLPEDGIVSAAFCMNHPLAEGKMIAVCCADPDPVAVGICLFSYIDKYVDDDAQKAALVSRLKNYIYRMFVIGHDDAQDGKICSDAGIVIVDDIGSVRPARQAVLMDGLLKWSEESGAPVVAVRRDITSDESGCECRKIDRDFVDRLLETTQLERDQKIGMLAAVCRDKHPCRDEVHHTIP